MSEKTRGIRFSSTGALIIVNVGVYIFTSIMSENFIEINSSVLETYGQQNIRVFQGWYWQLFSAIFVHANVIHLVGNMVFLLVFGLRVEELLSKANYFTIYFASGLLGSLLSLLQGPLVTSVGASGAIFGLFGAWIAYLGGSYGRSITVALVYGFYLLILSAGVGVNVFAHFGGLLAGISIGYLLSKKRENLFKN